MNINLFTRIDSSKHDKIWTDYEKCFLESYLSYNLEEPIHLNMLLFNRCLNNFYTYLVRKIHVKMSKISKNGKFSKKIFFHKFSRYFHMSNGGWKCITLNCFRHHMVVRKLVLLKTPIIFDFPQIYSLFSGLLNLISYFRIFCQQVLASIFMWERSPNLSLHNANFGIFMASMAPEIFVISGKDTVRPDFFRHQKVYG